MKLECLKIVGLGSVTRRTLADYHRERVVTLRKQGLSRKAVAKKLKLTYQRVWQIELDNQRAEELARSLRD